MNRLALTTGKRQEIQVFTNFRFVPRLRVFLLALSLSNLNGFGATEFYVSPTGSDSNPGTKRQPFASLERARDAARELNRGKPERDFTVWIRGGVYKLKETVVFSVRDSAAEGHQITYAAYRDEKPVFSSGVPITNWRQEGKLWVADLPPSVKPFRTLYDATGDLPRARGPGFSPTRDYRTVDERDRFTLAFPPGTLQNWPNVADVDIVIRPSYGWILNILPLESVDEATGMARAAIPASYPMIKVRWGLRNVNSNGTVWVENVLPALDEPGEWVLNTQERKLYLWPRGEKPEGTEAPQLTELIRIEGEIDYAGPQDKPVRGLTFRGLSFTRGDRWPWEKDRAGLTLQHDWEMFDRPTAMVRLRGAEGIAFEKCRWFESGGAGIRMDLHAQSNRVTDSVLEHLGGAGILLAGYGPGTKDVNRFNELSRNHLHHIGQILWHAAAISVWQSGGNRIANNLIHDVNYTAITVSGRIAWRRDGDRGDGWRTIRWKEIEAAGGDALLPKPGYRPDWKQRSRFLHGRNNLVERNEIHDVMQQLWDGDAIYVSGTGGGNRVRENFIRDCLSENMCEGIRCDDDQHETIIERNVILRNGGMGVGIAIKGINHVLNNFIVDPTPFFHHRGMISLEGVPVDGAMIQRNILIANKPGLQPFAMKNVSTTPDPQFRETQTDFNLFWNANDPKWADAHLATACAEGVETHSLIGDPRFRNPAQGDFRFKSGSVAPQLGIQPIDLRKVGLRK
ncbi:MAG TPA: right-handed parallel beta-helix repeat-containing protein [Verrucomicrobiae bacterium]|nr:right-handed parallel beta-helix repeat-containing protein [Verrucomicrobiae bacterium]